MLVCFFNQRIDLSVLLNVNSNIMFCFHQEADNPSNKFMPISVEFDMFLSLQ